MSYINFRRYQPLMRKVLLVVLVSLAGCGGGSDSGSNDQQDEETIWYFPDASIYFSISTNYEIKIYECTLYDGFAEETSSFGYRENDDLVIYDDESIEPYIYQIVESETTYLIFDDFQIPFEVVSEIPMFCNDNTIEIIDVSPIEAVEGVETTFTVSFEYRLTNEEAIVEIGFTSGLNGSYTISNQDFFEISSSGIGSGTLTVNHIPILLEELMPYFVHINLSPIAQDGFYSPFSTDRVRLAISDD